MNELNDIESICLRCRPKMLRLASLLLRNDAAAEDVVSDVFLETLKSKWPERNAEGFLLTATRNRSLNHLKRRSSQPPTMTIDEQKAVETALESRASEREERLQEIERFIGKNLTEQTRRVLTLRFRERLKYQEIAEELEISEAAVYKHLAKGLERLKQRFNP